MAPIFVWRLGGGSAEAPPEQHAGDAGPCRQTPWDCGFCGNPVHQHLHVSDFGVGSWYWLCHLCGFIELSMGYRNSRPYWNGWTEMREFTVAEPRLALDEVGAHLQRNFVDIRDLPPRRLEQLVAHSLREHGLVLELTKATRDGGRDLLVFSDGDHVAAIIEVKHWRNAVGVEEVRKLRGVQVRDDVGEAVLITSGRFSRDATIEADAPHPRSLGYRMTLLDAHDVLSILGVYRDRTDVLPAATHADSNLRSRSCADATEPRPRYRGLPSMSAGSELMIDGRAGIVIGHSTPKGTMARVRWKEGGVSLFREPLVVEGDAIAVPATAYVED